MTYAAAIGGVCFQLVEASGDGSALERITVEARSDGQLLVEFHLTDVFTIEEAERIVHNRLHQILDRLGMKITADRFCGAALRLDELLVASTLPLVVMLPSLVLAP